MDMDEFLAWMHHMRRQMQQMQQQMQQAEAWMRGIAVREFDPRAHVEWVLAMRERYAARNPLDRGSGDPIEWAYAERTEGELEELFS